MSTSFLTTCVLVALVVSCGSNEKHLSDRCSPSESCSLTDTTSKESGGAENKPVVQTPTEAPKEPSPTSQIAASTVDTMPIADVPSAPAKAESPLIIPKDHVVFVSRATFSGKLGGLPGADTLCAGEAKKAGYGGSWKAILSDQKTDAKARLVFTKPIVNTKGKIIATDANELWSGNLKTPVAFDEKGIEVPRSNFDLYAWSGTYEDGEYENSWFVAIVNNQNTRIPFACNNWTSDTADHSGNAGYFNGTGSEWIAGNAVFYELYQCNRKKHLYCVSQ